METFGRYRLLRQVAVGGMAELFLARTASIDGFDKDLVIKRIRPELSADELFVSMFIDEARLSMLLAHPNVVQVFDFGQVSGQYYLAMEFVHGTDLGALLELPEVRQEGLAPEVALYVMGEVCRGLDHAYTRVSRSGQPLHIVHRDVSPRNILLSYDGVAKVADFGIAHARGRLTQTEPGMVVGKLVYMAPEQATAQGAGHPADIFAAGAVLWELLTGAQIYGGQLDPETLSRIRHADVRPPSQRNRRISRKLDRLVMRALAAEPSERYPSARDFGRAISEYLAEEHPRFSHYDLQAYLAELRPRLPKVDFDELEEDTSEQSVAALSSRARAKVRSDAAAAREGSSARDFDWSDEFVAAVESFRGAPNLWAIVRMGDLCRLRGQEAGASVIYRVAATKFAQRSLMAESLLACRRLLEMNPSEKDRALPSILPLLRGVSDEGLAPHAFLREGPLESLLIELLDLAPARVTRKGGTPLLSYLDGGAFQLLAERARHLVFAEGSVIVEQGTIGRTMYVLASGRALVRAQRANGERVYLASLAAGDFFGENGFFTGAPRSATVEALYPTEVFELDEALYAQVIAHHPEASATLLRFYKERVVDVVLAKSPVFGLLDHEDRRALLARFELRTFEPGAMVLTEGELSDQIYVTKDGQAQVFTTRGGERTELSVIGPGTLFGEVAALRQIPRTASVQARTRLEVLELAREHFQGVLDRKPELKRRVVGVIAERVRENLDKLLTR